MKPLRIFGISLIVFIVDLLTKAYIKNTMRLYQSFPVLGDFLRITYIENSGMAFGIPVRNSLLFTLAALAVGVFIMIYLYRMHDESLLPRFAMALIFGGAVGNLWDRVTRGSVVDFIDVEFFDIHIPAFKLLFFRFPGYSLERWPVFNVADIGVTVGMLLLIAAMIWEERKGALKAAGEVEKAAGNADISA